MKKRKLTFKQQALGGIGLIILSCFLSQIFQNGMFHNIAWIVYGLMFIINPVWPQFGADADPKKMKKACCIAGVICILVGVFTRFGI